VLGRGRGAALEHLRLRHPFYDREVAVILGDHVTTDAGTGAVHTAPDHGVEDFTVGTRYGIGTLNYIDDHGVYRDDVPLFAGMHVYKVDEAVIEALTERGNLLALARITHSYPHCWRTKTPLIFRATPQWFISMTANGLLDRASAAIKDVVWHPGWGEARIEAMLANSPDWCISRQRTWGVPIALFVHKHSGHLHPDTSDLIEAVAKQVEKGGIDAWYQLDAGELLGAAADDYAKVTDTLDVWFDSGVTHDAILRSRRELGYPADLYLEGSDQHRGWFQSSLKTAIAINDSAPYRAVLTHGFTVDAGGHKMSKSLGNVIAPQQVINEMGADVLRLWVASTDFSGEMTVSDEILKRTADSYRRIRNTARFLLANLDGFDPEQHAVPVTEMIALDRWVVDRAALLQREILAAYDSYNFHGIYQKLHNFCVRDLGGFYLDIIKDRQYTCRADSLPRRSAQTALHRIAEALARWLAPILSFTAEEIWACLPGAREDSVFLTEWFPLAECAEGDISRDDWEQVIELKEAVNKAMERKRANAELGGSLEAEVTLFVDAATMAVLTKLGDELRFLLITSKAEVVPLSQADTAAEATDVPGLRLHVGRSSAAKCVRCWHHRSDVGVNAEHPQLCRRCVDNVDGKGEVRSFA
jgi:isoleucyl-tRNA synthetase